MKLNIKVIPKSSCNKVIPQPDGSLKVKVTAPAIDGSANKSVIEVLADFLNVKKHQLQIVKGLKSREKIVEVIT